MQFMERVLAGLPAALICQTYVCWGKSISLSRHEDIEDPNQTLGSSRALGVRDSCT